jgi:hypothetical protein
VPPLLVPPALVPAIVVAPARGRLPPAVLPPSFLSGSFSGSDEQAARPVPANVTTRASVEKYFIRFLVE